MENIIVTLIIILAFGFLVRKYWNSYNNAKNKGSGCDSCDCRKCGLTEENCSSHKI